MVLEMFSNCKFYNTPQEPKTIHDAIREYMADLHRKADDNNKAAQCFYHSNNQGVNELVARDLRRQVSKELGEILAKFPYPSHDDLVEKALKLRADLTASGFSNTVAALRSINSWGLPPSKPKVEPSKNLIVWEARGFTYRVGNHPSPDSLYPGGLGRVNKTFFKNDPLREAAWFKGWDRADKILALVDSPEVISALVKVQWDKVKAHNAKKQQYIDIGPAQHFTKGDGDGFVKVV